MTGTPTPAAPVSDAARRRRARWTVLVLALVALAVYAGSFYLMASAGH